MGARSTGHSDVGHRWTATGQGAVRKKMLGTGLTRVLDELDGEGKPRSASALKATVR